jgi:hypothetical protein
MPQQISILGDAAPLSILSLLMNLGIGVFLSLLLRWHFRRFGSTLSNREEFAQVFPFILLTTVLIITVVKSSLALSLGLVGALSIVRFRTPIKEPEELAYLFIAIAMGLGLGANQTIPTVTAGLVILFVMALFKWKWRENENKNLYLSLNWEHSTDEQSERLIERFNEVISRHSSITDLRRFDVRSDSVEATYFVDIGSTDHLSAMVDELRSTFPLIGVTFIDQNQLPTV